MDFPAGSSALRDHGKPEDLRYTCGLRERGFSFGAVQGFSLAATMANRLKSPKNKLMFDPQQFPGISRYGLGG